MNSDLQLENIDMFTNAEMLDIGPSQLDWSDLKINIGNVQRNHHTYNHTAMANPLSHKNAEINPLIQSPNLASSAFGIS